MAQQWCGLCERAEQSKVQIKNNNQFWYSLNSISDASCILVFDRLGDRTFWVILTMAKFCPCIWLLGHVVPLWQDVSTLKGKHGLYAASIRTEVKHKVLSVEELEHTSQLESKTIL